MITHRWTSDDLASDETIELTNGPAGWMLQGLAKLPIEDEPATIHYSVFLDPDWHTRTVQIEITRPSRIVELTLNSRPEGWFVDGEHRPDLDSCVDIDLGWSPATNTLPIRRLQLAPGQAVATTAAWVRFPEFEVQALDQRYERLAQDRYRYHSTNFTADLVVNADGLVTTYGDDLWVTPPT